MGKNQLELSRKQETLRNQMARILIVEDEPNMVAGLRDNFEFEGYDVITAPDGVAGLERALSEAPDLVILDVMMPRMSGLEVCKQLKAKRPSVPIIMDACFDDVSALKDSRRQHRRMIATNQHLHRMFEVHFIAHTLNLAFSYYVTVIE